MTGFWRLLRGELGRWVGRRGVVHLILWTVLIQGQLYANSSERLLHGDYWGFDLVVHLLWIFPTLGAIALAQSAMADERSWGTAGWVMARPVTRPAFVTAKVVGIAGPLILIAIVLQGLLAYWWLPGTEPERGLAPVAPDLGRYAVVLAAISLLVLLFVALGVALGSVFRQRSVVAGVLLLVFFLFMAPPGQRDSTWHEWFPGGLVEGLDNSTDYKRLSEYLLGGPLDATPAILVAGAACVALTVFGAWRFSREEL